MSHRITGLENELKALVNVVTKGEHCKLHLIRAWRTATGATLQDSKRYIESLMPARKPAPADFVSPSIEQRVARLERLVDKHGG